MCVEDPEFIHPKGSLCTEVHKKTLTVHCEPSALLFRSEYILSTLHEGISGLIIWTQEWSPLPGGEGVTVSGVTVEGSLDPSTTSYSRSLSRWWSRCPSRVDPGDTNNDSTDSTGPTGDGAQDTYVDTHTCTNVLP